MGPIMRVQYSMYKPIDDSWNASESHFAYVALSANKKSFGISIRVNSTVLTKTRSFTQGEAFDMFLEIAAQQKLNYMSLCGAGFVVRRI
jgi:hypothetical protein